MVGHFRSIHPNQGHNNYAVFIDAVDEVSDSEIGNGNFSRRRGDGGVGMCAFAHRASFRAGAIFLVEAAEYPRSDVHLAAELIFPTTLGAAATWLRLACVASAGRRVASATVAVGEGALTNFATSATVVDVVCSVDAGAITTNEAESFTIFRAGTPLATRSGPASPAGSHASTRSIGGASCTC